MKALLIAFFSLALMQDCQRDKAATMKDTVLEYHVTTRGFFRHITVKENKVLIYKDRNSKEVSQEIALSNQQLKNFIAAFDELALEDIATYKAPSEKRFYDGAAIATFKVTHRGTSYESQPFDHLNPPAELERIVTLMADYTKDNE